MTRIWHWVLVVAVSLGWTFGEFMSFTTIQWHFYCGYVVVGLMTIRLIRGLIGPRPIRLRQLLLNFGDLRRYLSRIGHRTPSGTPGHNPLGALSVIAMLMLLTVQSVSGLFIESEDYFETAPFAYMVSADTASVLIKVHTLLPNAIVGIVVLHVGAILFYLLWKRENLIAPMIHGWKWVRSNRP